MGGGEKNTEERTKVEEKREDITNNCGLDAEFDQINLHLQDGLKSCIAQKVESARRDILLKQKEMKPPRRIWQCSDGHPLCENCRKKPEMNTCPTCRKYLVGRSTIAEKLARALYAPEEPENVNEGEEFNGEEER